MTGEYCRQSNTSRRKDRERVSIRPRRLAGLGGYSGTPVDRYVDNCRNPVDYCLPDHGNLWTPEPISQFMRERRMWKKGKACGYTVAEKKPMISRAERERRRGPPECCWHRQPPCVVTSPAYGVAVLAKTHARRRSYQVAWWITAACPDLIESGLAELA
jgi:hypothetical protein